MASVMFYKAIEISCIIYYVHGSSERAVLTNSDRRRVVAFGKTPGGLCGVLKTILDPGTFARDFGSQQETGSLDDMQVPCCLDNVGSSSFSQTSGLRLPTKSREGHVTKLLTTTLQLMANPVSSLLFVAVDGERQISVGLVTNLFLKLFGEDYLKYLYSTDHGTQIEEVSDSSRCFTLQS
ncbi:hypothetical protein P5673_022801 [Acropora cervicornis]|uniref:Uncharacterized protein n=1 Tax=Acropora cervicornis TaxID=6130 RepID=A0AAD9UZC6_ACRCE|nr:hypothetical protein P5673_022801 [Acropora cervicornis]